MREAICQVCAPIAYSNEPVCPVGIIFDYHLLCLTEAYQIHILFSLTNRVFEPSRYGGYCLFPVILRYDSGAWGIRGGNNDLIYKQS